MKKRNGRSNGADPWLSTLQIGPDPTFGGLYYLWRRVQHGPEKIIRWKAARKRISGLRPQSLYAHQVSIKFFARNAIVEMRPYVKMDESLAMGCVDVHDTPEGVRGEDKPAYLKTALDDLAEYETFMELCGGLSTPAWRTFQRQYLLQHALDNPRCFPKDARRVMHELKRNHLNEALFFQGVQMVDYILFGLEGYRERKKPDLVAELATAYRQPLEKIARRLPGFREVVWTKERADFFSSFIGKSHRFKSCGRAKARK